MKTGEKHVRNIHAVMVKTAKSKPAVQGISMVVDYSPPPITATELVFTLNELKAMVKECENY